MEEARQQLTTASHRLFYLVGASQELLTVVGKYVDAVIEALWAAERCSELYKKLLERVGD